MEEVKLMLQELVRYAEKNFDTADYEPGFTARNVRWQIEIAPNGKFKNIIPLGDEKSGYILRCPDMHKMEGGRSHFLIEMLQTIALFSKSNEEQKEIDKIRRRHAYFKNILLAPASQNLKCLVPIYHFLNDEEQLELLRKQLQMKNARPQDWTTWSINGVKPLDNDKVLVWWREWRKADGQGNPEQKKKLNKSREKNENCEMICFLSGAGTFPTFTHRPKIEGLFMVGGRGQDVMVGFDKDAFCSFGLQKAGNAAMKEEAVNKYIAALNHIIRKSSLKLAGAILVYWFKEEINREDDPVATLYEPSEITENAAQARAKEILEALLTGKKPTPPDNHYFAMTLSGASGRVMVRDWMDGDFKELVSNICVWFKDLEITTLFNAKLAREPKIERVMTSLLQLRKKQQEYEDWIKPLGPARLALLHIAIKRKPIPFYIIARLAYQIPTFFISNELNKILFGMADDISNRGELLSLLYARMGLLKAYFIRKGDNNMSAYLNKEHPEPAYHCGRILAVLASLQISAIGDVGAGVVQRYYVSASQTPGLILGRLIGNAKNHLNKLEPGLAFWYEELLAEIWGRIKDNVPKNLDLEKQTLFALGYYQQIADRPKKDKKKEQEKEVKNDY